MGGVFIILVLPAFFLLLLFANARQDLNILQGHGKWSSGALPKLEKYMKENVNYRRSYRLAFSTMPVCMMAAVTHYFQYNIVTIVLLSLGAVILAVAICFRFIGLSELFKLVDQINDTANIDRRE